MGVIGKVVKRHCNLVFSVDDFQTHVSIHTWPIQLFSQDYCLASHTTQVVCVNFIREGRDVQFNVDLEQLIFEKLVHGRFIYS